MATSLYRVAWREFLRSGVYYTACDTAALALFGLLGGPAVAAAGGLACVTSGWGLGRAVLAKSSTTALSAVARLLPRAQAVSARSTVQLPALARLLQRAQAGTGSSSVQLSAHTLWSVRVAAFLAVDCLTEGIMGFPGLAHHLAVKSAELEEVPLTGRQRPAMQVLSEYEREKRKASDEAMEENLQEIGPGAKYLPAHHPKSLWVQEELRRLRAAADALVVERYDAESAVAQKYAQHFAGHDIPVRVFCCQETATVGQASAAGIAINGDVSANNLPSVLAHELAHVICRHTNERLQNADLYSNNAICWRTGSHLLRCTGKGGSIPPLLAVLIGLGARLAWRWAVPSGPEAPATEPLLQPGQLGFHGRTSLSRDICQELEAERLAMLIMARAGMDPAHVPASSVKSLPTTASTKALVEALTSYAKKESDSLSVIHASERSSTGQGWPNFAKLAQMYAEVLPQARAIYAKHRPRPPWQLRLTRRTQTVND